MTEKSASLSNTIKLRGNIRVTENMEELLIYVSNSKKNKNGYWKEYDRLVDPIIISIFYGLYKSKKLPPLHWDNVAAPKMHEFNVDITPYSDIFNHYLFCLWLYENRLPNELTDIMAYRKKLYSFLEDIFDQDKWRSVIIPFYLRAADESEEDELSFIYRMWNSDTIHIESSPLSPEFLAMEFKMMQNEFYEEIIAVVNKRIFEPE